MVGVEGVKHEGGQLGDGEVNDLRGLDDDLDSLRVLDLVHSDSLSSGRRAFLSRSQDNYTTSRALNTTRDDAEMRKRAHYWR